VRTSWLRPATLLCEVVVAHEELKVGKEEIGLARALSSFGNDALNFVKRNSLALFHNEQHGRRQTAMHKKKKNEDESCQNAL
jgi:hypothetical protein